MTQERKEELFLHLKQECMKDMGYDEEDMEDSSIESEVNENAKAEFWDRYGEEYDD